MKHLWIAALPAAVALFLFPSFTHAQAGQLATETPGVVEFTHQLDAKKLSPGATVETRLTHAVRFADGTRLPTGTRLLATVAQDDMQLNGKTKLALRFTSAQMKGGKTIPIKATILNVATEAVAVANDTNDIEPVLEVPNNLNGQADQIDAPGIAAGADLHSSASSQNSGVFVATNKDDIKLPEGSKLELALAPGI